MKQRAILYLAVLAFVVVAARPVQAVIQAELPLKHMIFGAKGVAKTDFIFVGKVTQLDPERPTMIVVPGEQLQGKLPWERMPVSLKGEEKDLPKLLKRLADDVPLVVFVTKPSAEKYHALAYTNGTWFDMVGYIDGDKVRWVFVQCQPNFRRTFRGATADLATVVKLAVARKKAPPELDNTVAPGLGPEIGEKTTESGKNETLRVALAPEVKLTEPFGIDFDRSGNAYVVELSGGRVLKVDGRGNATTIAGALKEKGDAGDGGPAEKARFNGMHNLAVAASGDIYLADTWNRKVRKIDGKTGAVSTVAGTGQAGYSGDDGPAIKATFGGIYCVSLDPKQEKLYLADLDNRRIRAIDLASGIVSLVAGNGQKGVPRDDADAKTAPLVDPRAVAADARGNVYILERGGHALRVVDSAGKIRTVVGASGKAGATGDGGDAKPATLSGPKHLCIDPEGNVIIADAENNLIRKYLPSTGKIIRVAGTGKRGAGGVGGPPEQAQLARPHGVTIHADGTLYIVDSYNERVLRIEK
jgi:DNA-binding beta-propeller fold protein YncE